MEESYATCHHIAKRFKQLSRTQSINSISVSAVCQKANVNRSTFYYYFADKDELITWIIRHDISSKFITADKEGWLKNVTHLLNEFHTNAGFYTQLAEGKHAETLRQELFEMTMQTSQQGISAILTAGNIDETSSRFIRAFFSYGFTGMYLEYIQSGCKLPPAEYALRFTSVADHGFYESVIHSARLSDSENQADQA